ncbi:FAD-dependent monooxygenase [Limibaculum sp. M0105]|uniref:FAD-dependent monooxygenase n=1 Tax=Thermohalobaculum xanthum TaxID=2753746 RepID=A0A8J7MA44_9RHOB|nr:FAD-dependent monooxygenase [Thermohalobaculum xanthum]MBK0401121.1 FAD-dependent monooxygenase [Thermohalobaculum xanthum]
MTVQAATRHALVAGAGIGGTAAALALARQGWRVTLVERARQLGEVGAGLQVSPNAARCLDALGVLDRVAAEAFRPRRAVLRDGVTGREIFSTALGEGAEMRWGAPYLHVHRADLLAALADAAAGAGVELRLGTTVQGWEDGAGGVSVRLGDRSSLDADVLVAADGVRTALREVMHGPAPARFTGQVAWRALVPASELPTGLIPPDATVWAGWGRHVVTYYLRGGTLINLVAVEERADWVEEGWSVPGDAARLRAIFAGWHGAVSRLLDKVEAPLRWGLFDRPPPPSWSKGRVALLGDACHPMLPFMAQGAAMALEDAVVLADCLERLSPEEALARYEARRRPRATRVQGVSRANAELFHAGGVGRILRHGAIGVANRLIPGVVTGRLDWLYGHDATREDA